MRPVALPAAAAAAGRAWRRTALWLCRQALLSGLLLLLFSVVLWLLRLLLCRWLCLPAVQAV